MVSRTQWRLSGLWFRGKHLSSLQFHEAHTLHSGFASHHYSLVLRNRNCMLKFSTRLAYFIPSPSLYRRLLPCRLHDVTPLCRSSFVVYMHSIMTSGINDASCGLLTADASLSLSPHLWTSTCLLIDQNRPIAKVSGTRSLLPFFTLSHR